MRETDVIPILSTASNGHVVESYHEAVMALQAEGFDVQHVGLSSNLWYPGEASETYQNFKYAWHNIPRPSGRTSFWWHTEDAEREFVQAMPVIATFVQARLSEHAPKVFLIADDTGPLEVFLIRLCHGQQIPVILIEHGYGFAFGNKNNFLIRKRLYRRLVAFSRKALHRTRQRLTSQSKHEESGCRTNGLPEVKPFGLNGHTIVCTYSQLTENILKSYGVPPQSIRSTGYPYFDKFIRMRHHQTYRKRQPDASRKKILVFSGGYGIFKRQLDHVQKFYQFLILLYQQLSQREFEVTVRLKPGEDPLTFLQPDILAQFQQLNICYDDNTAMFCAKAHHYDLVIGDVSTLHFESILLGVPSLLFEQMVGHRQQKFNVISILTETLGVLTIDEQASNINRIIRQALSPSYIETLVKNLDKHQKTLFHTLDGKAGYRVGQVIKEVAIFKE